ncbi:hypothetical protein D3C72_800620 [compost metagenome]
MEMINWPVAASMYGSVRVEVLLPSAPLYQGRTRGSKPSGILVSGRMVKCPVASPR